MRWERRANRQEAVRRRMRKSGKTLVKVYVDAVTKRGKGAK